MRKFVVFFAVVFMSFPIAALSQGYTGITVGRSDTDLPDFDDSSAWSFQAGYRFGDYFALEGSYTDLGDWGFTAPGNVAAAVVEGYGVDIAILGILPITEKFELFGRVGYAHWEADITAVGLGGFLSADESGEDPTYGGGIAFNVTPRWNLSLGYQLYKAEDVDIDYFYVGSKYYFGAGSTSKTSSPEPTYQQQPTGSGYREAPQLRAKSESEKDNCRFIKTISTGSGGPGDSSYHAANAMDKAMQNAAAAGADSYYLVKTESTGQGAAVVIEALDCN